MFRLIVFLVSHGLALATGFALGIYLLPILVICCETFNEFITAVEYH